MFRTLESIPQGVMASAYPSKAGSSWSTAAFEGTADTSPMELSALGAHVDRCNGARGRMFGLRCAADSMFGFIAPRFVTTVIVVAIVFGVGSLIA